jgi:tRNA-binding EMAP/Myf-like protein
MRTICSGLAKFISIEELKTDYVLVWINLKPRKLRDTISYGTIMCATNRDIGIPELIRPPEGSKIGERIQLSGNPING